MEIQTSITKLYEAAMKIYENAVYKHEKNFFVIIEMEDKNDTRLLATFASLMKDMSSDLGFSIKVKIL